MYRGIAHLSKKTAGRIGKENWENKLFLTFSSIVWFWIGGFAAALCCAAAEFVLTKTISGTFFGSVLLIAAAFAVFAGFYGGILYLMRRSTFPKKTVRRSGCTVYDFKRSREELAFTKLRKERISQGERMPYERPTSVG